MVSKGVIIQASSRSTGHTAKVVNQINFHTNFDVIDLNKKTIGHFDYTFKNNEDDFNRLFKTIVQNYQTIVFATPVYWYTMSGLLKVFMDRISDFLIREKEYGKMLRGKGLALLSCSTNIECVSGFERPFVETAEYLGMNFLGYTHTCVIENELPDEIKTRCLEFSRKVIKSL